MRKRRKCYRVRAAASEIEEMEWSMAEKEEKKRGKEEEQVSRGIAFRFSQNDISISSLAFLAVIVFARWLPLKCTAAAENGK